jgi:hypothetical protein
MKESNTLGKAGGLKFVRRSKRLLLLVVLSYSRLFRFVPLPYLSLFWHLILYLIVPYSGSLLAL